MPLVLGVVIEDQDRTMKIQDEHQFHSEKVHEGGRNERRPSRKSARTSSPRFRRVLNYVSDSSFKLRSCFQWAVDERAEDPVSIDQRNKTQRLCANSLNMETDDRVYKATFPKGSRVRIQGRPFLENFMRTWKFHTKLKPEQLKYGGGIAEVESVGFYHGGDELYKLRDIPGIWHRQCLEVATDPH